MKFFCVRYPRNLVTDVLICLICIFCISLILVSSDNALQPVDGNAEDTVIAFLEKNGWEVDYSSRSSVIKTVPIVFDDTYADYSSLQLSQGFSLEDFKGKTVNVVSYQLNNFPGYENNENIFINIMLYNDLIIAADILCTSINGFITGAVRNVNHQN